MHGKVGRNLNQGVCFLVEPHTMNLWNPVPGDASPGDHEEENL